MAKNHYNIRIIKITFVDLKLHCNLTELPLIKLNIVDYNKLFSKRICDQVLGQMVD